MKAKPHLPACKCGNHHRKLTKSDDWYVDAPQYNNCFWTYFRYNDRSHGLKEIADMLGLSISAITTIERKAMEKLQRRLKSRGITLDSITKKNN